MPQDDTICLFCHIGKELILSENEFAYAIRDGFAVSEFHTLIIPKRHVSSYFELTDEELLACNRLLKESQRHIEEIDTSVDGFNIGVNVGSTAGQTIRHCHIHLIPRRMNDVPNPKGGVRHIIPGKGIS